MARSQKRGSQPAGRGSARESRATSKKAAPAPVAAEVEVVEEGKGLTIDDGIVLMTTVILVIAFFLTDYILGTNYGKGIVFAG